MAVKRETVCDEDRAGIESPIPPPFSDGIEYVESLGRWVDNLFGDRRIQRAADRSMAQVVGPQDEPDEPELVEPPDPVPDGTETLTRNDEPDESLTSAPNGTG